MVPGGNRTCVLRPDVREDNRIQMIQENFEADGEVLQSFLVEYPATRRNILSRKSLSHDTSDTPNTTRPIDPPQTSVPPRPSEIYPDHFSRRRHSVAAQDQSELRPRCIRAL